MVEFQEGNNGQWAEIKLAESFQVSLKENRTTGFRWNLAANGEPGCRLTGEEFEPVLTPGAPGVHHWRFQAVQAGATELKLVLERPWARTGKAAKTFSLRVQVKA